MPDNINEKNPSTATSSQRTPVNDPSSNSLRPPCATYSKAKRDFLRAFPRYAATESTTGRTLKKEYATLLGGRNTYADYGGAGQPMASVLRRFHEYQRTTILGNPHSENQSSSRSSRAEHRAREVALRFVEADSKKYGCVWTGNASGALGLIQQHYPRAGETLAVILTEDIHNSMNGIRTALSENGKMTVVPVDVITLRVDEKLFREATPKLAPNERGLVLLTAQSNLSGIKHNYGPLLRHAKQNGWDTVLDVAALLPTTPFSLADHPEVDTIVVSWYKIVGRPEIGSLIATHAFLGKMHKAHFAGGTVEYVRNDTIGAFGLLEGVDNCHDGTIAFSAPVHLCMALEAMRPNLRADGRIRVQCLAQWLAKEMLRIGWPNRHPLIRIVGSLGPPESFWQSRGGTISFVPYDAIGNRISYATLFCRLAQYDIDLRHGCMCNTLGAIANPGLSQSPTPGWRWVWDSQHGKWSLVSTTPGVPDPEADTGVVRISLGLPSTFEDIFRILECLQSVVTQPLEGDRVRVRRKKVEKRSFAGMKQWCIS